MGKIRKEIHVVSVTNPHLETDAREDDKNNRLLQRLKRRHRLTGRYPPKVQAVKVKALLGREAEYHAQIFFEECIRIRHVTCGTLPCVTITGLNADARMVKICTFRHVEVDGQPSKKSQKSGGKGSVALLKESFKLGSESHDFSWDQITRRQILQGNVAPHQNSGKKRVHREA